MLKRFFLNALSSFVGAWAAIVLLLIGAAIFVFGMVGSFVSSETAKISRHSILKISLGGEIDETESDSKFDYTVLMNGSIEKPQTLKTLTAALRKASLNSDIEALYIECNGVSASPATLNALRNTIKEFKKSGKRVFAYGDVLTMGDYFVASAADAVYLNPAGSLDLQGIGGTTLYMKELLDKIGVEVQVVRVGSFKSAVEPYISNEMSEPAKLQLDTLYGEMWWYILDALSKERKVEPATVNNLVNNFVFLDQASDAKKYGLVDDCLYQRQVMKQLADYVGVDTEDINFVSPETIVGNTGVNFESKNQIAVVYAVGDIGEYEGAGINCNTLVPIIVRLAENEDVKGMVLRVNSPGGSVFGSEQIGEALDYFKSQGKPLAVSMGDYAASGGYWISAGADRIFADPLTITGSIGIFGMVPNVNRLITNIGLHPQTVSTNPGVAFPSIFYPMSAEQQDALQANINRGYEKFIDRVARGRNMTPQAVKKIAEGRVWSAVQAQKLGLVDQLGGLQETLDWVKEKSNTPNPNVVSYPEPTNSIWSMLASSDMVSSPEVKAVIERLHAKNIDEKMVALVGWFLMQNHVQARCPYYKISL